MAKERELMTRIAYLEAAGETPSSSQDTERREDGASLSSTSSKIRVRVALRGESPIKVALRGESPPITATVMFLDCNATVTPRLVQRFLREGIWTVPAYLDNGGLRKETGG